MLKWFKLSSNLEQICIKSLHIQYIKREFYDSYLFVLEDLQHKIRNLSLDKTVNLGDKLLQEGKEFKSDPTSGNKIKEIHVTLTTQVECVE